MAMRGIAWLLIALLILGVFLAWGGEWIIWDWINSIVNGPWLDRARFCEEWFFYAPLFVYKWTCETWTGPFDLGKAWMDAGILIVGVSCFLLGYAFKPGIDALLRRLKARSTADSRD